MSCHHPICRTCRLFFTMLFVGGFLEAAPVGEHVTRGRATFDRSTPGSLIINQGTDRAIIQWQDFSIGAGELTKFIQPSASSAVLNRVVGGNMSKIYGTLEANGQVYLVNNHGILIAPGGVINTAGFIASTLDLPDASFLDGATFHFTGDSQAGVVNHGVIEVVGGDVYLIARTVDNAGAIQAADGTVGLAAGMEILLQPAGEERIAVLAGSVPASETDAPAGTGVNNQGLVEAASAELKAAGGNVYALAINNGGEVRATSIVNEGGRIMLRASGGNIENSGTLAARHANGDGGTVVLDGGHNANDPATVVSTGIIDVRGDSAGSLGGEARVLGDHVGLGSEAEVDASGDAGGGTVLVGGDFQGANPDIQNAARTVVASGASIRADAGTSGDGGRVIVWADDSAKFFGNLSARGGAESGDGGFAEISGKNHLAFNGELDLRAPAGQAGTVLFDPLNIELRGGTADGDDDPDATDTGLGANGTIDFADEGDPVSDPFIIFESEVEGQDNNIVLNARNGFSVSGTFDNADVLLQNDRSLTIQTRNGAADGDVGIDLTGSDHGADLEFRTQGSGSITITSGTSGTPEAATVTVSKLTTENGTITLSAEDNLTVAGALVTGDRTTSGATADITLTSESAAVIVDADVTTGSATVADAATGQTAESGAVTISAATSVSGSGRLITGNATLTGAGAGGSDSAMSGNISVTASGGGIGLSAASALTTGDAARTDAVTDSATAGDITLNSQGEINNGTASTALDITVGTASGATANSPGNLTVATTGAGGNIFISSGSALRVGDVDTAGGSGQDVSVAVTGGGALLVESATRNLSGDDIAFNAGTGTLTIEDSTFGVGDGDLTLTGDEIELTGGNDSFDGTGNVTLQPFTVGQAIAIAGAGGSAALDLTAAELGNFDDGFSSITIGRSDGTHAISIAAVTFDDPVVIRAPSGAGSISVNGLLTGADDATVTLDGATTTLNAGITTANDDIIISDSVVIGEGLTVTLNTGAGAGQIQINGTVNGTAGGAAENLTLSSGTGAISLNGNVGNSETLGALQLNGSGATTLGGTVNAASVTSDAGGTTVLNGGTVTTSGNQTYNDNVTLGAATTLAGGDVTLAGTVGGAQSLTVNASGATTFGGAVNVASVTTDMAGSVAINGGSIMTSGAQTYNDALTLGADTVLTGTAGNFAGSITGGNNDLTLNFSGLTTLSGASFTGVDDLTTGNGGVTSLSGTITTAGTQTYNDAVQLTADTTLDGDGVDFTSTIDIDPVNAWNLTVNGGSGAVTLGGAVGGGANGRLGALALNTSGTTSLDGTVLAASVLTDAGGSTEINGGSVNTSGAQTYNDGLTLGADTVLTGTAGTFAGSIMGGNNDLTLNFSGLTTLSGASFSGVDNLTTGNGGMTSLSGNITTSGLQTYNDAVLLTSDTTLDGVGVIFGSTVDRDAVDAWDLTVDGNAGAVSFNGAVGGGVNGALGNLTANGTGTTTLGASVAAANVVTDAGGTTAINGGTVTTASGNQTYNDNVTLGAATTLTGVAVEFGGTVSGAQSLTVNASGATTFGGAVNVAGVQTDAPGTTVIDGGAVTTSGAQIYSDAVTLGDATTLAGSSVSFLNTVGGAEALIVNSAGTTIFGNAVNVASLITDAPGSTAINGNTITTSGAQTYNDAVTLGGATTLAGSSVNLVNTVSGAQSLTVNSSGTTTFGGSVNVAGVTTDAGGTTAINGGTVTTTGNQLYNDNVTLGAATTLAGAAVTLGGSVSGSQALTINASGATTFNGAVSVASVLTDAPGTTVLNGGTVMTSGNQRYNDAVTLGADTTLTGVDVNLANTVGGAQDLTVNASGTTTFGGAVNVAEVTTDAAGSTVLNGGTVTTTGDQTYNDDVTLGVGTILAGANLTLADDVGGIQNLVLNSGGATTLGGEVNVMSLATDAAGTTAIDGQTVTTTAEQTYGDAVTLGDDTMLTASGVTFSSTVSGGANDLTVRSDAFALNGNLDANRVVLGPRTAGQGISLGGADAAGILGLSAAELGFISANVLRVGNAGAGNLSLSANVNLAPANVPTLVLETGGNIQGAGILTVQNLGIDAAGTMPLTGNVDVLAASIGGAGNGFSYTDNGNGFTVGTVDGIVGIETSNGDVELVTDDLEIANVIDSGAARTTLRPFSAGRGIQLGTEVGGDFSLTDAELDRVTAMNVLKIGDASSGNMVISDGITLANNRVPILSLESGGNVTETGDGSVQVTSLAIRSGGSVSLQSGDNLVANLAADVQGGGSFSFVNNGPFNQNVMIDGITGINAAFVDTQFILSSIAQITYVRIPVLRPTALNIETTEGVEPPTGLTPGEIWTSYLQLPVEEEEETQGQVRIEETSKWTGGRHGVSGSTTGLQSAE